MNKNVNLLEGSIFRSLATLAVPIMLTSLLQMAYNLTDMIWIGRVGSDALAAVGAAGMYMWLANGLCTFVRMGGQVRLANKFGDRDIDGCVDYAQTTFQLGIVVSFIYAAALFFFSPLFISFFTLTSESVVADAEIYLKIAGGGMIFQFFNLIVTGLITSTGNSRTPFAVSMVGLITNMILDPMLIFGFGIIPALGVAGAATATVMAQFIVSLIYLTYMLKDAKIFSKVRIIRKPDFGRMKEMIKISLPVSLQAMSFTLISMVIARLITGWGDDAIAVQKIGSQIESISWMITDGFASALTAFIAQNYGAAKYDRAYKGYKTAYITVLGWGLITTGLLVLFPSQLYNVFLPNSHTLQMGVDYLVIIGYSQVFMCSEIIMSGAFSGYGFTAPTSISSVTFTALRIPIAYFLGMHFGLNGVWWTITLTTFAKGIIAPLLFKYYYKKKWAHL